MLGTHFSKHYVCFDFSSKSVSGGFSLVDLSPFILMYKCTIVVFLGFSRCFLISFSVRPGHVFSKTCLIDLRRLDLVGMKSAACKYWARSGFEVCTRMLFTTFYDFCVPRGTSHIPVFLFLVPLIISFQLFWVEIYFLSIVMVHPSSHETPNDINGAVCILEKCGSASLSCLDLVAGVLLYVRNPLCFHLVVLLSCHFT